MEKPSLTEGMHIQHIQLFFIFQFICNLYTLPDNLLPTYVESFYPSINRGCWRHVLKVSVSSKQSDAKQTKWYFNGPYIVKLI